MPPPDSSTSPGFIERSRRMIHKGKKYDYEMVTIERPNGRIIEREVVRHPGAVVIVPVLPDRRLAMISVYRIAPGRKLLEFPAGTLEKGEDPAFCAGRELIEETGYKAATLAPLGWFHTTPGLTDEKMYAFVASGLQHVGQDLEEDEEIDVVPMTVMEVIDLLDRGDLHDAKSMLALSLALRKGLIQ